MRRRAWPSCSSLVSSNAHWQIHMSDICLATVSHPIPNTPAGVDVTSNRPQNRETQVIFKLPSAIRPKENRVERLIGRLPSITESRVPARQCSIFWRWLSAVPTKSFRQPQTGRPSIHCDSGPLGVGRRQELWVLSAYQG